MSRNVFMTGVSGYLGLRVARALAARDDVARIVGIDIRPPDAPPSKLEFHRRDVRAPFDDLLEGTDTAVHLAWVLNPTRSPGLETAVNLGGTRNFLKACDRAGVPHLVGISSATAYGAFPENPVPLTEEDLVRPDQPFQYAREKAQMEGLFRQYGEFHPDVGIALLRPCIILGPGVDNFISRSIQRPITPLVAGWDPPMQFLHEDDLVAAVAGVVTGGITGTYNVAPEGTVTVTEGARMAGARVVGVPERAASLVARAGWRMRLDAVANAPVETLSFVTYPWVVDGSRLREAAGLTYQYDSRATFAAYLSARGRLKSA
jgi:UDP-glucose 4-epimerase